jgi:hypothetical protein
MTFLLHPLDELREQPAGNKEHYRDADKEDVHRFPSIMNISTIGINLPLRISMKALRFHKDDLGHGPDDRRHEMTRHKKTGTL